jgi:heptose-I-phosphate ethanolaminephosphotransferase
MLVIFVIFPFLIGFLIKKYVKYGKKPLFLRIAANIYVYLILLACLYSVAKFTSVARYYYNPLTVVIKSMSLYKKEVQAYKKIKENVNYYMVKGKIDSKAKTENNIYVIILGESANRNHMSLYGYYRKTTPILESMHDELYVFKDVISPHSHTTAVARKVFTFYNYESTKEYHEFPTIINCLSEAGFKTYWISNQEMFGIWGSFITALASQANVDIFNQWRKGNEPNCKYDGDLVDHLDSILVNDGHKNKFIFIHLVGHHASYRRRYPLSFDRFDYTTVEKGDRDFLSKGKMQTISEYDNSILYNDFVVSEIIKRVKKENKNAYVLYVGDHGEEVYDNRDFKGHSEKIGNRFMIEIPFILWVSDIYKKNYPDKVSLIEKSIDHPYMTDDLIHMIFDLSSLFYELYEPERSVININYRKSRKRFYAGKDYDKTLKHDTSRYLISDNFNKLWAHRINNLEKLEKAIKIFSGVELDVVFKREGGKMYFDVYHPPSDSIGLSLERYFDAASSFPHLRFWLDLKNLSPDNKHDAFNRLNHLIKKYDLRKRIILESKKYSNLDIFTESGIYTSYYLPKIKVDEISEEEKKNKTKNLIKNITSANIRAISYTGYMYEYVKECIFPRTNNIEMLTWFTSKNIHNKDDAAFLQKIVNDKDIRVVVVKDKKK